MKQNNSKHSTKKYKKTRKKLAYIIIVIIIVIIGIKNKKFQNTYADTQLILNNENITSKLENNIINENGEIYMSLNDVQKFLDETIYQENGKIITTSDKKIAVLQQGEDYIEINSSKQELKDIVLEKDEQKYLAISEMEKIYDYEFSYSNKTNIAAIDSLNKKKIKAVARKSLKVKSENNNLSRVIEKVSKGDSLIVINEEENGFVKIRTLNETIGFVKKNLLENFETIREDFEEKNYDIDNKKSLKYDISTKDITTFEKRLDIANLILQEAIKNDKIYVKIIYNGTENEKYTRFKIELKPILKECGIKIYE